MPKPDGSTHPNASMRAIFRNIRRQEITLTKRGVIQGNVVHWDFDKYDEEGAGRYYLKLDALAALDAHLGRRSSSTGGSGQAPLYRWPDADSGIPGAGAPARAQQLTPASAEMCAVDGTGDVGVLVAQQVARLLGVITVHRGAVAERVEVRQAQLAALHLARDVVAASVKDQVAAPVGLEEFREHWSAVRRASALLGAVRPGPGFSR